MDSTQILLTIVLTISTVLALIIGIQLILVLKELRKSLKKINVFIEAFESVGFGLEHGFGEIIGFVRGVKSIIHSLDLFSKKKHE